MLVALPHFFFFEISTLVAQELYTTVYLSRCALLLILPLPPKCHQNNRHTPPCLACIYIFMNIYTQIHTHISIYVYVYIYIHISYILFLYLAEREQDHKIKELCLYLREDSNKEETDQTAPEGRKLLEGASNMI